MYKFNVAYLKSATVSLFPGAWEQFSPTGEKTDGQQFSGSKRLHSNDAEVLAVVVCYRLRLSCEAHPFLLDWVWLCNILFTSLWIPCRLLLFYELEVEELTNILAAGGFPGIVDHHRQLITSKETPSLLTSAWKGLLCRG